MSMLPMRASGCMELLHKRGCMHACSLQDPSAPRPRGIKGGQLGEVRTSHSSSRPLSPRAALPPLGKAGSPERTAVTGTSNGKRASPDSPLADIEGEFAEGMSRGPKAARRGECRSSAAAGHAPHGREDTLHASWRCGVMRGACTALPGMGCGPQVHTHALH